MRSLILALVATAALASASAAFAQMQTSNEGPSGGTGGVPMGVSNGVYNAHNDTTGDKYDLAVMMLKRKVDRVTRQDGGRLTADHLASLQAELDALNHQFGAKPARRASFGHREAAPGPSSSSAAGSD